jgi:DNA invertase Pin-like site-specific DNA recombinase
VLFEANEVSVWVLSMAGNQALDTATSTGRLMLSVIAAVSPAEREAMLERQREGIAKAKREGRYKGRVPTSHRDHPPEAPASGPTEIAVRLGIGRASVHRVLASEQIRWLPDA